MKNALNNFSLSYFSQLWPGSVCLPQLHGLGSVLLILEEVWAETRGHMCHCHKSIPQLTWAGGDDNMSWPGRWPRMGSYKGKTRHGYPKHLINRFFTGGQNNPQEHKEMFGCWHRSEYGDVDSYNVPEYSVPSVVLWSLHQLDVGISTLQPSNYNSVIIYTYLHKIYCCPVKISINH